MIPDLLRFWGASPSSSAALIWVSGVFVSAYLLGSIPSGILVTKALGLGDLKKLGSGNIGATNVLRTGNYKAASITLLLDAGKGLLAVYVAEKHLGATAAHFAALGVFCGHLFSLFLFFRGGKGVATFLGILIILNFYLALIFCLSWLIIAFLLRYSSLASLISSFFFIFILFFSGDLSFLWLIITMVTLIWFKHRENLLRLAGGKESKISFKEN